MILRSAEWITSRAIEYKVIPDNQESREIYIFSFQLALEMVLSWTSILVLSYVFNVVVPTLLFMIFFIPLRICSGGYHASTFIKCYSMSVLSYCVYVCGTILLTNTLGTAGRIALVILLWMIILYMSPVTVKEKPISAVNRIRCKSLTRIIATVESVVIICLALDKDLTIYFALCLYSHIQQMVLLIAGEIRNKQRMEVVVNEKEDS